MKHSPTRYIKPSFFIFLVIAALLWYGNKLEDRYTTDLQLPLEIRNDYTSKLWIEQPRINVTCRLEGIGGKLMAYKMDIGERLVIPMSQLTLIPVRGQERTFRIDKASLTGAMSAVAKDLRIHQILDTAVAIRVSPVESRRMPLKPRIEIHTARQYMQVGTISLTPDSVDVRGPKVVLDSIHAIFTRPKYHRDLRASVTGRIDLEQPGEVILSVRQADYHIEILPYTQHTLELPVRVTNLPEGLQATIVPSRVSVVVNVPLRDYERIREERIHASVNYNTLLEEGTSGKYPVQIDSLPQGTEVTQIQPQFVEPFFTRR